MTHLRTTEGISRSEASTVDVMLGETRGAGQFGKSKGRGEYKRRFNRAVRRLGRLLIALAPERES